MPELGNDEWPLVRGKDRAAVNFHGQLPVVSLPQQSARKCEALLRQRCHPERNHFQHNLPKSSADLYVVPHSYFAPCLGNRPIFAGHGLLDLQRRWIWGC